eukprot:8978499-Pyramimonas_sp.AAC.1
MTSFYCRGGSAPWHNNIKNAVLASALQDGEPRGHPVRRHLPRQGQAARRAALCDLLQDAHRGGHRGVRLLRPRHERREVVQDVAELPSG